MRTQRKLVLILSILLTLTHRWIITGPEETNPSVLAPGVTHALSASQNDVLPQKGQDSSKDAALIQELLKELGKGELPAQVPQAENGGCAEDLLAKESFEHELLDALAALKNMSQEDREKLLAEKEDESSSHQGAAKKSRERGEKADFWSWAGEKFFSAGEMIFNNKLLRESMASQFSYEQFGILLSLLPQLKEYAPQHEVVVGLARVSDILEQLFSNEQSVLQAAYHQSAKHLFLRHLKLIIDGYYEAQGLQKVTSVLKEGLLEDALPRVLGRMEEKEAQLMKEYPKPGEGPPEGSRPLFLNDDAKIINPGNISGIAKNFYNAKKSDKDFSTLALQFEGYKSQNDIYGEIQAWLSGKKKLPLSYFTRAKNFTATHSLQAADAGLFCKVWYDSIKLILGEISTQMQALFANDKVTLFLQEFAKRPSRQANIELSLAQQQRFLEESLREGFWKESLLPARIDKTQVLAFMFSYGFAVLLPRFGNRIDAVFQIRDPALMRILEKAGYFRRLRFWYDDIFVRKIVASLIFDVTNGDKDYLGFKTAGLDVATQVFKTGLSGAYDVAISWLAKYRSVDKAQAANAIDKWSFGLFTYANVEQMCLAAASFAVGQQDLFGLSLPTSGNLSLFTRLALLQSASSRFNINSAFVELIKAQSLFKHDHAAKNLVSYFLVKNITKKMLFWAFCRWPRRLAWGCQKLCFDPFVAGLAKCNIVDREVAKYARPIVSVLAKKLGVALILRKTDNLKEAFSAVSSMFLQGDMPAQIFTELAGMGRMIAYRLGDHRMLYGALDEKVLNNIFAEYFSEKIAQQVALQGSLFGISIPGLTGLNIPSPISIATADKPGFAKNALGWGVSLIGYTIKGAFLLPILSLYYVYCTFLDKIQLAKQFAALEQDSSLTKKKRSRLQREIKAQLALTPEEARICEENQLDLFLGDLTLA